MITERYKIRNFATFGGKINCSKCHFVALQQQSFEPLPSSAEFGLLCALEFQRSSALRRISLPILLALLGLACLAPATGRAEETTAAKPFLSFVAEYKWRKVYPRLTGAKAMAVSPNGAIGFGFGKTAPADARTSALDTCNEFSKYIAKPGNPAPECNVLAEDDKLLAPFNIDDASWQQPSKGKDTPMRKGRVHLAGKTSRGIILHVHGCNGLGDKIFSDVWGAYFNAMGFDYYAPDSFAEKRPKEVCGLMNDYPAEQVSTVWRMRVAQTQRTLATLRKTNPGEPIYLWGHSEGGLIVQMIETDIAGIIVSGEECGVLGAPIAASAKVPLLFLWGEYDQYVNGVGYRITQESTARCAQDFASHNPQFAILEGRSHIPWPWNQTVSNAFTAFLNSNVAEPKPLDRTRKINSLWKRTKPAKKYRTAGNHKAAAINTKGTSYQVWDLDNEEDARQLALFGCTRATSKKTNVFKTGKHLCAVVDINGKAPE